MYGLVIALVALILYAMVGRKLLPMFTEFQVRRIFYRYPEQVKLDGGDQKSVLWYSAWQSILWPLALLYVAAWNASGALANQGTGLTHYQHRQQVIDNRVARRSGGKSYAKLMKENRDMAKRLGLDTDEYE